MHNHALTRSYKSMHIHREKKLEMEGCQGENRGNERLKHVETEAVPMVQVSGRNMENERSKFQSDANTVGNEKGNIGKPQSPIQIVANTKTNSKLFYCLLVKCC